MKRKNNLSSVVFAAAIGGTQCTYAALGDTNWADWVIPTTYELTGQSAHIKYTTGTTGTVIDAAGGTVNMALSGEINNNSSSNSGWLDGSYHLATNYISDNAKTSPDGHDRIVETGYTSATYKAHTLTFDKTVSDVVMAHWSLGSPGNTSSLVFSQDFSILSTGSTAMTKSLVTSGDYSGGYQLSGNEGAGVIQFLGSYDSISWTVTDPEYYAGLTIGITNNGLTTTAGTPYEFAADVLPPSFGNADIKTGSDDQGDLGSTLNYVYDGGTLTLTSDDSNSFAIKNGGGKTNIVSGTLTKSGVLSDDSGASAAGSFEKLGAGTLILSGTNTYTGGTVISAGTLQIASDANLGGSAGAITLDGGALAITASSTIARAMVVNAGNGSVDVDTGDIVTLTGVVSGAGDLELTGSGTVILTGTNTNTGNTLVKAGTLQVSSDQNLGASSAGVTLDGGALAITASSTIARAMVVNAGNGSVDVDTGDIVTLTGVVSGAGDLELTGSGTVILTGTNTHTGATNLTSGLLSLDGSTASSTITVASGTELSGSGSTTGNVIINGNIAPGASPGTLSVAGDFTMNSTSTFDLDVDGRTYSATGGAGSYDRIAVTGATSVFTAAGTIAPITRGITGAANNTFTADIGDSFRVVTTAKADGVAGVFSSVTAPASGMAANTRLDVDYGANYIDLVITPDSLKVLMQGIGVANGINLATGLDTIRPAQGANGSADADLFFNGLMGQSSIQMANTLLQASGQNHAFALDDVRNGASLAARNISRAALRGSDVDAVWLDTQVSKSTYNADGYASAYDSSQTQVWSGKTFQLDSVAVGIAAGGVRGDLSTQGYGSAKHNSLGFATYIMADVGAISYNATMLMNQSETDAKRTTTLASGVQSNASKGRVKSIVADARATMDVDLTGAAGVKAQMWAGGTYSATRSAAYTETGSALTSVSVAAVDMHSLEASFGGDVSGAIADKGQWSVGLGAIHTLNQGDPIATTAMSMHGASWEVTAPQGNPTKLMLSADMSYKVTHGLNVWLSVSGSHSNDSLVKSGSMGLRFKW